MRYAKAEDNPFLNPQYVSDMSAGGYSFPSFDTYKLRYPRTRLTPEAYYSKMGAYELAARYNPIYAWGAQLAKRALVRRWITGKEYQAMRKRGFARADGTPLAPIGGDK